MLNANTSRELIDAILDRSAWANLSMELSHILDRYAKVEIEGNGDQVHVRILVMGSLINFEIINHALVTEKSWSGD